MNKLIQIILTLSIACTIGSSQPVMLTRQEAANDLEFFIKTLEEKHPNPGANFQNYRSYKDSLVAGLPESILHEDFAQMISLYANLFRDGHTFALNSDIPDSAMVLPFDITVKNNRVYILHSLHENSRSEYEGAEIIRINGIDIDHLIKLLMPYVAGETRTHRMARLESGFAGLVYRVLGEATEVELRKEDKNHLIHPSLMERQHWLRQNINAQRPKYDFELMNATTALITFNDMGNINKRSFAKFLKKSFKELKANNIDHLIIDLRHNGGGNFLFGQMLIAYLTDKPYTVHKKYQYDMAGQKVNLKLINDITPPKRKNKFTGNIYFLTGAYTYSSSASIISAVKSNNLGQVIGKPIGQPYSGYIDMSTFNLPKSKLLCGSSTVYYEYIGINEVNKFIGIPPDIDTDEDALVYLLDTLK